MPLNTKFLELVRQLDSMSLPKIVYLDVEGTPDMILDGDIIYQVEMFTDHWNDAVRALEGAS